MSNDYFELIHTFGNRVVEALNAENVEPSGTAICGLIVIVGDADASSMNPPLSQSINYDRTTKQWKTSEEVVEAESLEP